MQLHEHRNQWKNNEKLIEWLQENGCSYLDWLIVITFYTALHKVDELIHFIFPDYEKKKNSLKDTTHHVFRIQMVAKYYRDLHDDFHTLYRRSRKLRYYQNRLNLIKIPELTRYLNIWYNKIKPREPYPIS